MPRLSLYRPTKSNDYKFLDKSIAEMFTVGGTDLYIHKYLGPADQGASVDYTQPQYDALDPTNIQDLLFLENRDRTYDTSIYRLRGHYNVQNLDFDLSQFGLFLNNDIIFITVHYNDMIDIVGRKLMVGDVLELPHLLDYHPLKETIPTALKRFYQITDANFASEGFSQTWYPHLWRIKCEPLVASQEFSQILQQPTNTDTYLGNWDSTKTYPPGYTITFGDKNYTSITTVPDGVAPPNEQYWQLDTAENLKDILSTYNKNIQINDAALAEAARLLPKSGYDTSPYYIVPTYGEYTENSIASNKSNQPAPPINIIINYTGAPGIAVTGTVQMVINPKYKKASPVVKVPKETLYAIWQSISELMTSGLEQALDKFVQTNLEVINVSSERTDTNSGPVSNEKALLLQALGAITGPYGTSDNMYSSADQDPVAPNFNEPITPQMDYRADCDPRFQYIARATPRSFGYTVGYLTGTDQAPNGIPTGTGISFPQNPQVGDYFLRIDYFPQVLFRWDGQRWVRISENVRTGTGFDLDNTSQLSSFINNDNMTALTNGTEVSQSQPLSTILRLTPDPIPPIP